MVNLLIVFFATVIIMASLYFSISEWKEAGKKNGRTDEQKGEENTSESKTNKVKAILGLLVAIATFFITVLSIQAQIPELYCENSGYMPSPDSAIRFEYKSGSVWYTYDSNIDPIKDGEKYTEPFIPTQSGELYFKAKFLWAESERGQYYIKTYDDVQKEAGLSVGDLPEESIQEPVEVDRDILEDNKIIETTEISQDYMPDEDHPPNLITWGWGDTSEGNQGRSSYTIDEINELSQSGNWDKIVFNSISNSNIGDERNFVAARLDDENNDGKINIWNNNLIEVEAGKTYLVRLYGHNNSPYGNDAIAEDVQAEFLVPNDSGRTIVINGMIKSSNANPDRYWDSVVLTSKNRFHLEPVEGSALMENNGIGAGGGVELPMDIVNGWVDVGFDELDGKIPGCYKYDFYITVAFKVVGD